MMRHVWYGTHAMRVWIFFVIRGIKRFIHGNPYCYGFCACVCGCKDSRS